MIASVAGATGKPRRPLAECIDFVQKWSSKVSCGRKLRSWWPESGGTISQSGEGTRARVHTKWTCFVHENRREKNLSQKFEYVSMHLKV